MVCYFTLYLAQVGHCIQFIAVGHFHSCEPRISPQSCTNRRDDEICTCYTSSDQRIKSLIDNAGKLRSHLAHVIARLLVLAATSYQEDAGGKGCGTLCHRASLHLRIKRPCFSNHKTCMSQCLYQG